jgi:nucleotide-binding universal stress UspA family protein
VYPRVLVAYDGSERSRTALPTAELAAGAFGCPLQLVHVPVAEDPPSFPQEPEALVVDADTPAAGLIEQVRATDPVGLLCMSSRGRGPIGELVFGSVAAQVVRNLQAPLLILGPNVAPVAGDAWRRMLVCLDGSQTAAAIVPVVRDWALTLRLQVHLLHIAYPLGDPRAGELRIPEEEQAATEQLRATALALAAAGIEVSWSVEEDTRAAAGILTQAGRRLTDLIALATHGRTGLARMLAGSTALDLVRQSTVPTLLLRPENLR